MKLLVFKKRLSLKWKSFSPLGHLSLSTWSHPSLSEESLPSQGCLDFPSICSPAVQNAPELHAAEPLEKADMGRWPKAKRLFRLGRALHPQKPQSLSLTCWSTVQVENLGPALWLWRVSSESPGELNQMHTPHLEPTGHPSKALCLKLPQVTDDALVEGVEWTAHLKVPLADLGEAGKPAWIDHPSDISYTTASHECTHPQTGDRRSREKTGDAKAGEPFFLAGHQ